MGKRVIYVGGMAEIISDRCLRELFSMYGLVSDAYIVRQKQSSKSAGYGFVEMASGEQALRAVVALEGAEFTYEDLAPLNAGLEGKKLGPIKALAREDWEKQQEKS